MLQMLRILNNVTLLSDSQVINLEVELVFPIKRNNTYVRVS